MSKTQLLASGLHSSVGGSTSTLTSSLLSSEQNRAPLYALPYAWALRLRRNKFILIKLLLLLSITSYFIILIRSRFDAIQQIDTSVSSSSPLRTPKIQKHNNDDTILKHTLHNSNDQSPQASQLKYESHQSSGDNDVGSLARPQQQQQQQHQQQHQKQQQPQQQQQMSTVAANENKDKRLFLDKDNNHDLLQHPKVANQRLAIKRRLEEQLKFLLPTRDGWGEGGEGVTLINKAEKDAAARRFSEGAFNVYVSDRISVNRSLKAVAAQECQQVKYNVDELPNVSVIIIFTNEIFSTLIRTIWSVINRSPGKLLKEVILVDDFSDSNSLKQTLQDYIDVYWPDNLVRLYHLPERQGLIKARLKGADVAKGDVLLFLDSHCEVSSLWLEPLLQRIKDNRRVFICPVIDIISDKTLEYNPVDPYFFQLGGFDWTGHFTWINRRQADVGAHPTRPVKSPTMAGGLFAVDRKYFYEVGAYDRDMLIWGGENLELSFRVWQCGGRIEIHPCSHVGHIFRDYHPYSFQGIDSHGINTVRTVRVWMEDYARYFFMSRPDLRTLDVGDLSERYKLKKQLQCGSFKTYLEEVYENRKFIYDQNVRAYGFVQNKASNLCLDTLNRKESGDGTADRAGLYECDDKLLEQNLAKIKVITNQLFSMTSSGELRRELVCLVKGERPGDPNVYMDHCEEEPEYLSEKKKKRLKKNNKMLRQKWQHHPADNDSRQGTLIINQASEECLTTAGAHSESDLKLAPCDSNDSYQLWRFSHYIVTNKSNNNDSVDAPDSDDSNQSLGLNNMESHGLIIDDD